MNIVLIGLENSGKTTLLNLIIGLYQPITGKIFIDSQNLSSISPTSLYNLMSVVFQDAMLFNTSIYENIRFGNLNATQEMIESAAKAAKIHDFILNLPLKYNTIEREELTFLEGNVSVFLLLVHSCQALKFCFLMKSLQLWIY